MKRWERERERLRQKERQNKTDLSVILPETCLFFNKHQLRMLGSCWSMCASNINVSQHVASSPRAISFSVRTKVAELLTNTSPPHHAEGLPPVKLLWRALFPKERPFLYRDASPEVQRDTEINGHGLWDGPSCLRSAGCVSHMLCGGGGGTSRGLSKGCVKSQWAVISVRNISSKDPIRSFPMLPPFLTKTPVVFSWPEIKRYQMLSWASEDRSSA